ncbi:MAG: DUF3299 domain-containing protein [Planctomycetaceae bacterium]
MATAEVQLSSVSDGVDYPYRAISLPAVFSLILSLPALVFGFFFAPLLGLALVGMLLAIWGLRTIKRYPDEYDGRAIAMAGLVANGLILLGGSGYHGYVYATEVPEGYSRVAFYELQTPEHLPDLPTAKAVEIDGQPVFLKGYIHPSSGSGLLRRFILVPDLGTCCFGGQPRSTDMIEVTLSGGQTVRAGMTKLRLAGKFMLNPQAQKTADFDNRIYYQMRVDQVR